MLTQKCCCSTNRLEGKHNSSIFTKLNCWVRRFSAYVMYCFFIPFQISTSVVLDYTLQGRDARSVIIGHSYDRPLDHPIRVLWRACTSQNRIIPSSALAGLKLASIWRFIFSTTLKKRSPKVSRKLVPNVLPVLLNFTFWGVRSETFKIHNSNYQ